MAENDVDDAKTGASLARLRLFLASHAPNGPGEHVRPVSPPRQNGGEWPPPEDDHVDFSSSDGLPRPPHDRSDWEARSSAFPELLADEEELEESCQTTIPAAGAAASVKPMSQSSKEFARVKYLLQCSLPGYRVHEGVVIWDMRNPSLVAQYEQHTAGLLELESWVAVNDLGADMGDAHSYGFTSLDANQTGMKFPTGNLQLSAPPPPEPPAAATKTASTRQLVLCKIAVGRSLIIRDEEEAKAQLPPGYHSYYLHREDDPSSSAPDHEQQELQAALLDRGYYHEYILNSTLQIMPQYLVRFTFSAADAQGPAVGPCALCEQHPAVVLCRNCEAQICAHCDQEVHSANKLVRRHKRTPLRSKSRALASGGARRGRRRSSSTPALAFALSELVAEAAVASPSSPTPTTELTETEIKALVAKQMEEGLLADETQTPTCRTHRGKKVEFYCPVCLVPVCVSCKMVGDHSIGEKGAHRLLTVAEAYESCLRESLRPDRLIASRKTVIENKLQSLTRAQRGVQDNKAQVAAAIKEQCARVLQNLDEAVALKMRVLSGEALEFERQLQQIDWVDESLEDHRTLLPAVEFLSAWSQHKLLRAEQRDFPPFAHGSNNFAEQVKADLQLAGELRVMSAEQLAPPHYRLAFTSNEVDTVHDDDGGSNQRVAGADGAHPEQMTVQRRRPSDSDIRNRLVNIKSTIPIDEASPAGGMPPFRTSSRTFGSPKCQELLDDIGHDLLVQSSPKTNPNGSRAVEPPSPSRHSRFGIPLGGQGGRLTESSATHRSFSMQPMGKKGREENHYAEPRSPDQRQRRGAWSTLLRHVGGK
ncbi:hypothetical protein BBJ28_00007617 [Nothophytophthora sp. Chile5]|nr:hypothetical protein BBJ28_00007617 [Nothophytophthora sp. Chile5]